MAAFILTRSCSPWCDRTATVVTPRYVRRRGDRGPLKPRRCSRPFLKSAIRRRRLQDSAGLPCALGRLVGRINGLTRDTTVLKAVIEEMSIWNTPLRTPPHTIPGAKRCHHAAADCPAARRLQNVDDRRLSSPIILPFRRRSRRVGVVQREPDRECSIRLPRRLIVLPVLRPPPPIYRTKPRFRRGASAG